MRKIFRKFAVILPIILLISACSTAQDRTAHPQIDLDSIARDSKLYEDDTKALTKSDMAVWLVKIIDYYNNYSEDGAPSDHKTNKELLSDALSLKILHGSNENDVDDEKKSTREEAFTMIDRAFRLDPPMDLGTISAFKDYSDVSTWAADAVHDVVTIVMGTNETHIFDEGLLPSAFVNQDEIIHIITPVIKSQYCNIPELGLLDRIFRHIVRILEILGIPIIAILAFIYKNSILRIYTWFKIRKEIIYIGDSACGKTELSNVLPDPNRIRQRIPYAPTRGIYESDPIVIKDDRNNVIFHGIPTDTPGDSNYALLRILKSHKLSKLTRRRTIIILLLAHNKAHNAKNIDNKYLNNQYNKIDKVYIPTILKHIERIERVIVFVNKCDMLNGATPENWDDVQQTIYKRHFNLLSKYIPDNKLRVAFGSATNRTGIDRLRELLL